MLSEIPFTVEDDGIRFGLGAVKNVGVSALEEILGQRGKGEAFKSVNEFCSRVDLRKVNRRVIESLIKSGAFDCCGDHRAQLLASLDQAMERGQKAQRDRDSGQITMFEGALAAEVEDPVSEVPRWSPGRSSRGWPSRKKAWVSISPGIPLKSTGRNWRGMLLSTSADLRRCQRVRRSRLRE
jgi:DNA polymerase III alpha subunit